MPSRYEITFPHLDAADFPESTFEASDAVLVIPFWDWISTSERSFGPPIIVAPEEISSLKDMIPAWKGVEVIRVFGHEGGKAPHSSGVLLVSDTGVAARVNRRVRGWLWSGMIVSTVGPRLKSNLDSALSNGELSREQLEFLFGRPYGEILGTEEDLSNARNVRGAIGPIGNDEWTTSSER